MANKPVSTHKMIRSLGKHLGYFSNSAYWEGVCHGFTIKWIEACLLQEKNLFNQRIAIISEGIPDTGQVNQLKEKIKKGESLTEEDQELLDILAFYEHLALYQNPFIYGDLFTQPYNQTDIALISQIASSDKTAERGGLVSIYSEPWLFADQEITHFFTQLAEVINDGNQGNIGLLLSNASHAVGITYDVNDRQWILMNINEWPAYQLESHDVGLITDFLRASFNIDPSMEQFAFNVRALAIANEPKITLLANRLEEITAHHVVTEDIAKSKAVDELVYLAAEYKHVALIKELAEFGVNLDKLDINGVTPAYIATQNGHAQVINVLGQLGADLDQPSQEGTPPVFIAAQHGHAHVIAELAKHGVDLNKAIKGGRTPAYIAAQNGHAHVIAELAKHGVDLNKAIKGGFTPAYTAAQNGHAHVIAELAKHGVDLNKAIKGGFPPAYIAAQNGHAHVIAELAKQSVDLNKVIKEGVSLAYIAAERGYLPIIAEMERLGIDLHTPSDDGGTPLFIAAQTGQAGVVQFLLNNPSCKITPFISSIDSLKSFAKDYDGEVIRRMDEFILSKNPSKTEGAMIALLPKDIAFIMGHQDVVELFNVHANKNFKDALRTHLEKQEHPPGSESEKTPDESEATDSNNPTI